MSILASRARRPRLPLAAILLAVFAALDLVGLVGCSPNDPQAPSTSADAAEEHSNVSIDLDEPLRCTILGLDDSGARSDAAGASGTRDKPTPTRWVQRDMQPRDVFLRLPLRESELEFEAEVRGAPTADASAFRVTVTSDETERTLEPVRRDGETGSWHASLAPFDGEVVRLRFEKLVDEELHWVAPTVRGRAPTSLPALAAPPPNTGPFNVVLYVVDTLRADRMSLYGHSRETSPNVERLAARALVFDNAYANGPSTLATMPAMFSSRHASMLRAQLRRESGVETTLPEALRTAGYRTGGFQANPWVSVKNGFDRGFDLYDVLPGRYQNKQWKSPRADAVHRKALRWLDEEPGSESSPPSGKAQSRHPFFLFLQVMDVHAPYEPPRRFEEKFPLLEEPAQPLAIRPIELEIAKLMAGPLVKRDSDTESRNAGRYEGSIAFADEQFGDFMQALSDRGLADDTVVFLTADHGEALGNWDDGTYLHGHSLHEELVRVPLMVVAPWQATAARVTRPVSVLDLAPTIFELTGAGLPAETTGRSLFVADPAWCPRAVQGELTDPPHHEGPVAAGPRPVDTWYVREGHWKLLGGPQGRGLFDLHSDPREVTDVRVEHPILTAYLHGIRRASVAYSRAAPDFREPVPRAASDQESVNEALRQLGYIE